MGIDIRRQGELVPVSHEHREMTMHIFYIVYTPVHEVFFFFQIPLRHKLQPRVILWVLKLTQFE